MKKYRIESITQETTCGLCGAPICVGSIAYASDDEINVYCSKECYKLDNGVQEEDNFTKLKRHSPWY